jgi:hypothetical protein
MFGKSSDRSPWELFFDFILGAFFLLPLLFVISTAAVCDSTAGIGSKIVCVAPALEPLGYVAEVMVVVLAFGGFLLYGPVILIAYVGSTVHKIRQLQRRGIEKAFAQYRWGLAVWLICTILICLIVLGAIG